MVRGPRRQLGVVVNLATLADGVHPKVPDAIYHERLPGLVSSTAIGRFIKSPAHYKAWLDGSTGEESSAPLDFGRGFHCAALEPDVFARKYAVEPDFGSCRKNDADGTTTEQGKENKARRDTWRSQNAFAALISADDWVAMSGMAKSIREHPIAGELISCGEAELTALWTDEETGLRCKARADYYRRDLRTIIDIKTTTDASPHEFERSVAKWGYHRQRALYGDGFAACGAPVDNFVFLVVEKTPPYAVGLYVLDLEGVVRGRESVRAAMTSLADCLRADVWPAYSPKIVTLSVPKWAA